MTVYEKTTTFGAVLIMVMAAFTGLSFVSDESDAAPQILDSFNYSAKDLYDGSKTFFYVYADVNFSIAPSSGYTITHVQENSGWTLGSNGWLSGKANVTDDGNWTFHIKKATSTKTFSVVIVSTPEHPGIGFYKDCSPYVDLDEDYYVKVGSPVHVNSAHYSNGEYLVVESVTSGYGLSIVNGSLSGTISKAGTASFTTEACSYYADEELPEEEWGLYTNCYTGKIHAVSQAYSHTVKYNANGGTGTVADTVVTDTVNGNSNVTLSANGFSKAGYTFAGWKVNNTIYQPGQFVSVAANTSVSAIAQWTPIPVTITSSDEQADIVVGDSFVRMITTDPSGATLSVSGASWITLSGSTLVGTPSQAGDYTVTVTASNESSSDSQTIVIHVVNRLAFESVPTGGILATPVI